MKKLFIIIIFTSLLSCSDDTDIEEGPNLYYQTFEVESNFTWSNFTTAYDLNGDGINDITVSNVFDPQALEWVAEFTIDTIYDLESSFEILIDQADSNSERKVGETISAKTVYNSSTVKKILLNSVYFDSGADFADSFYLAYRITKSSDTYYGWMKLDFFQMKEFATNVNPDDDIIVGKLK